MILEFSGENRFLSNFWPSEVRFEGMTFPTVEHAFQSAKTLDIEGRKLIQSQPTPGRAKRMGKLLVVREDWPLVRVEVMFQLVLQKFQQEPLKQMLKETGEQLIFEGNRWGDTFWGIDLETGEGQNALGIILMEVRRELFGLQWGTSQEVKATLTSVVAPLEEAILLKQ